MTEVKLGNIVKDAGTGFTGTASMLMYTIGGNIHVTIQPPCPEDVNVLPQAEIFDFHLVDVVGPGVADRVHPQDDVEPLEFGKTYRDIISGFEGILTARVESLQGCVQYALTPKVSPKNESEYPTSIYFDYKRLELIDSGIVGKIADSSSGCIRHTDRPRSSMQARKA